VMKNLGGLHQTDTVAPSQLAAMSAVRLPALLTDAYNSGESRADRAFEPNQPRSQRDTSTPGRNGRQPHSPRL